MFVVFYIATKSILKFLTFSGCLEKKAIIQEGVGEGTIYTVSLSSKGLLSTVWELPGVILLSPLSFAIAGSDGHHKLMSTAFSSRSILWLCRWLEGSLFCRSFRTWYLVLPRIIPFSRSFCLSLIAFLLYPWQFAPSYLGISLQPATTESLFVISRIFDRSPLPFFRCKVRQHRCIPSTSRLSLFLLKITAAFRIFLLDAARL